MQTTEYLFSNCKTEARDLLPLPPAAERHCWMCSPSTISCDWVGFGWHHRGPQTLLSWSTHKLAQGSPKQTNESKLNQPNITKMWAQTQMIELYGSAPGSCYPSPGAESRSYSHAAWGKAFPPISIKTFLYFYVYTTS